MKPFATVDDLTTLWRPLTAEEQRRAEALLEIVSESLRAEACNVRKDLDREIMFNEHLAVVAKSVTVDVAARALMTSTNQEPMTQVTQSAGPYSATGTYLVPGGGLYFKKAELERLGLRRRQRYGGMDLYGLHD